MSRASRQAEARHAEARAAALDRSLDWETRARTGAVRTAWIVGGLALAFFIFALVQGHLGHLHPSWEPEQAPTPASAGPATPAIAPVPHQAATGAAAGATHGGTPSSRP